MTDPYKRVRDFKNEATFEGGVMRWKTNNAVPFNDVLADAKMQGFPVDLALSRAARDKDTTEFIAEYRKRYQPPDAEQLSEMRAAFGPGVTVVNVITGDKTKT